VDEEAGQEGAQLLGVGTNLRVRPRVRDDPDEVKAALRLLSGASAAPIRRWCRSGSADFADDLAAVLKREAGAAPTCTFDEQATSSPAFALVC
jgi:hypothetical protein